MIGTIKVQLNAAHPNMPLQPLFAFAGSPSNLRIIDVPKKIGTWQLTSVYVAYNYPDNTAKTAPCTLVGGAYVCTLEACDVVGTSGLGYTVLADGVDENGDDVIGYVLGKGDISILSTDPTIVVDGKAVYAHLLSAEPAEPQDGDMWPSADNAYMIQQDGEAHELGTPFATIVSYVDSQVSAKADLSALDDYATKASVRYVENYVSVVDERVTQTQNAVTTIESTLSTKADLSTLDNYATETYVQGLDNSIAIVNDRVTQIQNTVTAVESTLSTKADISATILSSIYGGNGEEYSDWSYNVITPLASGDEIINIWYRASSNNWQIETRYGGRNSVVGPLNATELTVTEIFYPDETSSTCNIVCTRTLNTLVGYILGSQIDSPLSPTLTPAQLSAIADVPNKADASALRYSLGTTISASAQLDDRCINHIVPTAENTSAIKLTFPDAVSGKARDFLAFATNTVGNTGAISFTVPTSATVYGDGFNVTIASGESWLFMVTEIASNVFLVKSQMLEVAP